MNNHSEVVSFIYGVANLIRDTFKRGKYQDVILPLTVLRRLDCVLAPTKAKVLKRRSALKKRGLKNLVPQLRKASGYAFYNTSPFDFEKLLADPHNVAANLRKYINGFSDNMREVLDRFEFDNTITKLDEGGLLFLVLQRFKDVDLHPEKVSNTMMGSIFEELIRRFNEALDENPGEHFTPREVIRLMVSLLLASDRKRIRKKHASITVYDPCCGTGGMLTVAKGYIAEHNATAEVHLFGQESQPETYAVCKSDLFMKSADGRDAENIVCGSTLSADSHSALSFDYMLANPPYGKDWKKDQKAVRDEHARGKGGRFSAGLPRISDGQILFLQHMLNRMRPTDGGSRVAIIMNGSPLFTGDAGSGESEIRRWILENDWLEAIVALPEQLFYNTGIATYVWVLTNRKKPRRRGKVQLVDATAVWTPMRRSLGAKRREISEKQIEEITALFTAFEPGARCRVFDTAEFAYRKITVERPLRLNFQPSPERIERLEEQAAFANLAISKKKSPAARKKDEAEGRELQEAVLALLRGLPGEPVKDRAVFEERLTEAVKTADVKLRAPVRKAILAALGERDETAETCRDKDGNPEPDRQLRDTENVPFRESIEAYFEREVKPHVPDAWINERVRDEKDDEVGKVGYEISFNRYFYKYTPPRDLGEIEADIRKLGSEIVGMLGNMRE